MAAEHAYDILSKHTDEDSDALQIDEEDELQISTEDSGDVQMHVDDVNVKNGLLEQSDARPVVDDNKKGNLKKIPKQQVRGLPKSGRFWKTPKEKFSTIIKSKGIKSSFEKKMALRKELERVKELSRQIKEQKQEEKMLKKERRRENQKRAEENRKKAEQVQIITNTAKIKRMKKKQLRYIEKRDTNEVINKK